MSTATPASSTSRSTSSASDERDAYFAVCWPNHERLEAFEYVRLIEHGDEVVVTYEATRTDGSRFRNTEVLTFAGDQVCRAEVYFGWDL